MPLGKIHHKPPVARLSTNLIAVHPASFDTKNTLSTLFFVGLLLSTARAALAANGRANLRSPFDNALAPPSPRSAYTPGEDLWRSNPYAPRNQMSPNCLPPPDPDPSRPSWSDQPRTVMLPLAAATPRLHTAVLRQLQRDGQISRRGHGDQTLHFDIGGEGPRVEDRIRSGFTTALNINSVTHTTTGSCLPIPALVQVMSFTERLPVANNTADIISMQGAPLDSHNVAEIARVIRPNGVIHLWVDQPRFTGAIEDLRTRVNGVIEPNRQYLEHYLDPRSGVKQVTLRAHKLR